MPAERPGNRVVRVFTKQTVHGDPAVELGAPGIAKKAQQTAGGVPNAANAEAAREIAVGEEAVIIIRGVNPVRSSLLPPDVEEGDALWITVADNVLADAADVGLVKFGVIESLEDPSSEDHALVNFNLRDTF